MRTPPLLALATSGRHGEVGLRRGDGALRTLLLGTGSARGRGVMPAISMLLRSNHLEAADLAAVAVDLGPGSFTGVRVGVTTAKSLALALGVPVVGVTSLAALARAAPPEREVLAIRDAGRGGLYHARFGPLQGDARPVLQAPGRAPAAEVLSDAGDSLVVGEEAPALLAEAGSALEVLAVRADAAAVLAEARVALDRGRVGSPHALVPVYLQASAPERRRAGEPD